MANAGVNTAFNANAFVKIIEIRNKYTIIFIFNKVASSKEVTFKIHNDVF